MTEGPFCAHQVVRFAPRTHENGSRTDHWLCECGQAFVLHYASMLDPANLWQVCDQHGPTVDVRWRSGDRCPLCESYESERRLMTEGIGRRIAEAAYRLGARDMRARAARVAQACDADGRGDLIVHGEHIAASIYTLDPTETEPHLTRLVLAAMEAPDEAQERRET